MLINLSNHPSQNWDTKQSEAAQQFGEIVDVPFPLVDPTGNEAYINELVNEYIAIIAEISLPEQAYVHVMGEMTLCFSLVKKLTEMGYVCLASTSERHVTEIEPGEKQIVFRFTKFRKYTLS